MVLRVFCRVIMIGRARKIKPEDEVMEREREGGNRERDRERGEFGGIKVSVGGMHVD